MLNLDIFGTKVFNALKRQGGAILSKLSKSLKFFETYSNFE